ncbi:hypothetical protein R5W24_003263 [Gemmata sp. JC717]|uniref:hypothetical protein n=1 Tax=Gemmata algarum TaxID=2975278 RepID=UPI0021BA4CC4|nr:hypothetical protein [Gemmata algarum]MDY3554144.1 hypothetical protein [Gemmata algarum]
MGCSSTPPAKETVVTGSVTLDGEKLTMGEVYFEAEDGSASARGEIAPDGNYRVPSAPLGKVKAAVRTSNHAQFAAPKSKDGKAVTVGGRGGTFVPVPKRYEEVGTSGLTYTVTAESAINITLSKK